MSVFIDGYEIDLFLAVEPNFQNQITSHPVENGAEIGDHIITKPITLVLQGVVSDTPFGLLAERRDPNVVNSQEAYDRLVAIREAKKLVTVITGVYPPFTNMALRTLSPPKSATTGDSIRFRVVFEQIQLVDVAIEKKVTLVRLPRQKKKKRKGHRPAIPKPDVKKPPIAEGPGKSILLDLLD